jgi:hypothetical protein
MTIRKPSGVRKTMDMGLLMFPSPTGFGRHGSDSRPGT